MKSKLLLATSIFAIFALNGCLDQVTEAPDMSALACTTEPLDDDSGLKIICGGDSVGVVLNGKDGKDGKDGKNGKDGKSGADGKNGADGKDGSDGTSCRVEENKDIDGFEVFCGEEKVGELRNGKDGADGKNGSDGTSCRVEESKDIDGYDILCGDEKVGELRNGKDGADGKNGSDGTSCRVEENKDIDGFEVFCGDEKVGELRNGKDGADGKNGSDGTSCRVVENKDIDGFDIFCGNEKVGELKNGKDGADGKNGKDGASCRIVENKDIDGFEVFCGDEKVGELKNGKDGADGKNGKDGTSCRIEENKDIDGFEVFCGDKKVGELKNGKDGADGKNGKDGTSCRIEENSEGDGYDVYCGNKKVGELKNGKDGADGRDGKDAKPVEILSNACNVLRTTTDMFSSMYDVFYCLRPNEKVTFILRHAARDRNNTGTNGSLNQTGIDQSIQVGQKLKKLNIDDFFYMHTNVYRTLQTARIISENKGQTTGSEDEWKNTTSNEYHAQNMDLLESWYIRNENRKKDCQGQNSWGWSIYSKVAYEEYDKKNNSNSENRAACEDALYNIQERTQEFISTHFTYDNMHKMTLAISHDQFLVPFVIAISHKKIHDDSNYTLQFHKHENNFNYWINYLTGVAIIVDSDNNNTVIPVTALDDGFLRSY